MLKPLLTLLAFAGGVTLGHIIPLGTLVGTVRTAAPHYSIPQFEALLMKSAAGRQTFLNSGQIEFIDNQTGTMLLSYDPHYTPEVNRKFLWLSIKDALVADITTTTENEAITLQHTKPHTPDTRPLAKGDIVGVIIRHDDANRRLIAQGINRVQFTTHE